MRLAALVAQLEAAEQTILDALDAAARALQPGADQLAAAYGEYAEYGMPRQLTELLATCGREDRHRLRENVRAQSFARLLKEGAKVYARPGLSITIHEHEVLAAVQTGGRNGRHNLQTGEVELRAVAAYLERTYGAGAGDRVAVQQLRAFLRDQLDDAPPERTARAITVTMRVYPESYPNGRPRYDYRCRERVTAVAEALTRALTLVGLHADDHTLARNAQLATHGAIESRYRQPCGAGLAIVTYQRKLVFELPIGAGTEFLAWLAAVETEAAA